MSGLPIVDKTFIADNQKLGKTMQKSKKGGPYSKAERQKRREEVYRLHVLYGLPATKIAEHMKVNRNTVNDDIGHIYYELEKHWRIKQQHMGVFLERQLVRLDEQRTRLLKDLYECKTTEEKLAIERLILDIDARQSQIMIKALTTEDAIREEVLTTLNTIAEEKKQKERWVSRWQLINVDPKKFDKIMQIMRKQ